MKSTVLFAFLAIALCATCLRAATIKNAKSRSSRSSPSATSCDNVLRFFESNNITLSRDFARTEDQSSTICEGQCCNNETESRLRLQARADFHDMIHHHSRSLQGLLATTADAIRDSVTSLARQSENKTLTLFDQVYKSMALSSRSSITSLYQAMVNYVSPYNTPDSLEQPLTRDTLQERFVEFFTRLFPIAYHRAVNPQNHGDQRDFTAKFKNCLYEGMDTIQPFGDIPNQVSQSMSKSLEATRVLLQALTLGKTVLDRTDSALFAGNSHQQESCYRALLRMTHCPRCKGLPDSVRPCTGFCTNVMRGCLTEPASQLDLTWSGYVGTVERLVVAVDGRYDPLGLNAERAVRQLDTRISDAVMHAMENGPALAEKVRKVCGRSELEPATGPTTESLSSSELPAAIGKSSFGRVPSMLGTSASSNAHKAAPTQLHTQLGNFLASVVRSRTFYGTLADAICEDYPDRHCWNGERIGEYAKTVVDSSLSAQRYNPEFSVTTSASTTVSYGNANTSVLIDQLRHINQIVQSQLASAPDSGALLGDEALDGSGSGDGPRWRKKGEDIDNDDEDVTGQGEEDEEASGSGMGPIVTDPSEKSQGETKETGGASSVTLSAFLLSIVVAVLLA